MGPPERRSNSVAVAALRIKIQPRVKNAQKNIFFAMRLMEIRVSGFADFFGLCPYNGFARICELFANPIELWVV